MRPLRFPAFRGNWSTPWVAGRYAVEFLRNATPRKIANASLAMAEMKLARARTRSLPYVLRLEAASICTLQCPRCSTGLGIDPRPKGVLSLADLDHVIDQVRDHVVFVRFDGDGEPLLNPNITESIRRLKCAGMGVALSTHGNTEPEGGWQEFVDAGVDRVMVAIDGADQETYERYRYGGSLEVALDSLRQLTEAKARTSGPGPVIDLQFLDWGYNKPQIPAMRRIADEYGVDRLTVINPDLAAEHGEVDPLYPKRCFWLWAVLTVDWELRYHTCTNAWTYMYPHMTMRDVDVRTMWNSREMVEARRFNKDKSSDAIAGECDTLCNKCTDMLVVPRPPGYVCE